MTSCDFNEKFKLDQLTLRKFQFWNLSIRPTQITYGSLILAYNGDEPEFGDISDAAYIELKRVVKLIESVFAEKFNAKVINYLMLRLVDSKIHFHVFPRYQRSGRNSSGIMDADCTIPLDVTSCGHESLDPLVVFEELKVFFYEKEV